MRYFSIVKCFRIYYIPSLSHDTSFKEKNDCSREDQLVFFSPGCLALVTFPSNNGKTAEERACSSSSPHGQEQTEDNGNTLSRSERQTTAERVDENRDSRNKLGHDLARRLCPDRGWNTINQSTQVSVCPPARKRRQSSPSRQLAP